MIDIFDIRGNILWLPFDFVYIILYALFLLFLYFIFRYLDNKKVISLTQIDNSLYEKEQINYLFLLENIDINLEKNIFYSEIISIFRDFLDEKIWKNISNMTFSEIKNLSLEENIESLICSIYFKEYKSEIEDNIELRKKILNEVKLIFSK